MDFALPAGLEDFLARLDAFIEAEIVPLQAADDNERFFDHRRDVPASRWQSEQWQR